MQFLIVLECSIRAIYSLDSSAHLIWLLRVSSCLRNGLPAPGSVGILEGMACVETGKRGTKRVVCEIEIRKQP